MSDQSRDAATKSPVEAVVDTFLYAPIGLLFEGASLLPQLVEKGRNQVAMARMVGKFAIDQATGEATKAAGKLQDQAAGVIDFIGGTVTPLPDAPPPPRPTSTRAARAKKGSARSAGAAKAAARKVAGVDVPSPSSAPSKPSRSASPRASSVPSSTDLAIPDYDGLSASHVVNRLAGLTADELEAVRTYEMAHRGRKTILSKIAQLQSA